MRNECLRCGYSWLPRIERRPNFCPNCKSPKWDIARATDFTCEACGHVQGSGPSPVELTPEQVAALSVPVETKPIYPAKPRKLTKGLHIPTEASALERADHNPKTCRIYGCLQCKAQKPELPANPKKHGRAVEE